jgi:hypothetical protein
LGKRYPWGYLGSQKASDEMVVHKKAELKKAN